MTGKAILWLKEGCAVELIEAKLLQAYQSKCAVKELESNGYHASEVKESRRYHAPEEKLPFARVKFKALFHIPDILKVGFNKTKRRRIQVMNRIYYKKTYYDKDNRGNMHLVMIDFINITDYL
jgi:hypothetical protein